ncbi:MAG: chitobiase/beta-hexosaminidase C-terminal domain-containing protein [Oscillospiraceae bacterium]|nr:chitobiase/beta-hexosaminidase C-terminal domain-containing protein [Oscillospiraceae bacterium]
MNKKKILAKILSFSILANLYPYTNIMTTNNIRAENTEKFLAFSECTNGDAVLSKTATENTFPQKYDLREYGLVSPVKNQGNYGTCWAFSALASIETSLIKNFPNIDLSELHLSYFTFSGGDNLDPVNSNAFSDAGGHTSISTSTLVQGIGPVSESVLPYDTLPETINDSIKHNKEYLISDSYMLNAYSKQKVYADDTLNFSENQIKEMLMQKNAVSINFKFENSYNEKTQAQYMPSYSTPNHAVTIIGWDDNFSRENFLTTPERDGAWLVKNSWGTQWGDNGFFWISYCDRSITDTNCIRAMPANTYSSVYQHDTLAMTASVTANNEERNTAYMANIFTAQKDEVITYAGLYTTDNNAEYEITIYTGLTDETSPVSGQKSDITSGTEEFAGYHTIKLDKPVAVKKGEKFSIVAKLTNPEHLYPIPVESCVILCENKISMNASDISKSKISSSSDYGESFISSNGTRWTDTKGMKIEQAYENISLPDTNVVYYIGNVCLKAFGDDTDKIFFSQDSEEVALGSKTELSSVDTGNIYYTTDGSIPDENSCIYTEPITITDDMTINAAVIENGTTGKIYSKHYTQAQAVLSSLTINGTLAELTTNGNTNTELSYVLEGVSDYVTLLPVGCCTIEINGKKIISGHKSENIMISPGYNEIMIRCTEEGKKTTEYKLNVFKNYASVDYFNETIHFDETITTVRSEDGHIFKDNENISDYFGKELTVTTNGKTTPLVISEKINLDTELANARISNSSELITMIFSVSSKMMFSASPDMSDAQSISERRYTILSENFFKIYPDYDTDLYFQIPATENSPESTIFHITVPPRPTIPDEFVKIDIKDENTLSFTIENAEALKAEYKIELKTSNETRYTTEIESAEKCTEDTTVITDLLSGETYVLYVHCKDFETSFSPYVKCIEITMPGKKEMCSFNFELETIIFNENDYTVTAHDNTVLNSYDCISDYIGTYITITDKSGNQISQLIPPRPQMEEIKIDFLNGKLTGNFDDKNSKYIRLKKNGYYSQIFDIKNLTDRNGTIWLESIFASGINHGEKLYFFIDATDKSFSSELTEITVPEYKKTDKKLLDIVRYTSNSIILEKHEGMEYGIRKAFRYDFEWQDSPVFENLLPDTQYILAARYKSTDTSMYSQPTYNIIKTLSEEQLKGDLDNNGKLSAADLVIMKKLLLFETVPDSYQYAVSDINNDKKTNVFDLKRLINKILNLQ